jgi:Na+-translocating ferredoxin:NAD+ oxidoreductase RNF subunit RnfB
MIYMDSIIVLSVVFLSVTAVIASISLLIVARKFATKEDPRIEQVAEMLPGVNCGACGFAGCHDLAKALVDAAKEGDIAGLRCPAGGLETMQGIYTFLGFKVSGTHPTVAVLRCGGSSQVTEKKLTFEGPRKCAIAHSLFGGEKGCAFGCLGLGDCVEACHFDALHMDRETELPVVDTDNCVSCGSCVKACPRHLFELRPLGAENRRVWVNCMNQDKGSVAMKICKTACIGCGKCVKECPEEIQAIVLQNNLAYIDPAKCTNCGKCIPVCPTNAIKANFNL